MQKRTIRVLALVVVVSTVFCGAAMASSRTARRPVSPLARLLIYIHSRLGPPWGAPSPEPVTATTTETPRVTQPKE